MERSERGGILPVKETVRGGVAIVHRKAPCREEFFEEIPVITSEPVVGIDESRLILDHDLVSFLAIGLLVEERVSRFDTRTHRHRDAREGLLACPECLAGTYFLVHPSTDDPCEQQNHACEQCDGPENHRQCHTGRSSGAEMSPQSCHGCFGGCCSVAGGCWVTSVGR